MPLRPMGAAAFAQPTPQELVLSGAWTAGGIGVMERQLASFSVAANAPLSADGAGIEALDTVGAWLLQQLFIRLQAQGVQLSLPGWRPQHARLLAEVTQHLADQQALQAAGSAPVPAGPLESLGRATLVTLGQALALVSFIGESALAFATCVAHPARLRWRPILHNIRSAGVDALPIVGLLSFLLGVVVAYQGAEQLRRYGANIFVVDLVGLSMLREFAPLITAIIVAGRSGSAYAAQIGTMAVTEEIDAMRTLGLSPQELLVLPKVIALLIALPLLTFFADVLGVLGGMTMARSLLGVGFGEFLDRFAKAVSVTSYLLGICKAPVFALTIAMVGCFQGFRTQGGADAVGRQTTRSVVQSIFLVIVADAAFSVAFSALGL